MKKLLPWLMSAGIITILFGTIYFVAQQTLRQTANDLPKQIADDGASKFDSKNADKFIILPSEQPVDIANSLAPFYVLYDRDGRPIGGNGYLHSKRPSVPYGVLTHATPGHDNAVTWQPETGVRADIVVAKMHNGYILAGHSLRETEVHESQAFLLTAIGWFIAMLGLAGGYILLSFSQKTR